ncbi:short chain dehydrogenase [Pyrenophora seminiperda CCB06]|uniref:Short chain dehydrogenase n=1 Tax=Pyrenophora seminiperda CCB06 TaxID=1302712 RepID=A0A3M7LW06_9PLEO|nr:short chain dehydrogenase [Pyrenophora seminiperda CCB06]
MQLSYKGGKTGQLIFHPALSRRDLAWGSRTCNTRFIEGSGIGFGVAEACTENGALVTVSSSNPERCTKAVARLQEAYPSAKDRIWGLKVDLGNQETLEEELKGLFEKAVAAMGGEKLDHVIYTAGDALKQMALADMTVKNIIQAGQVRFFAPLLVAKFLPTYLNSSYKSSYTITTGAVADRPIPNWSVIASYAGGGASMVRNLALDLKPIRVNGVSPGVVDTELWDAFGSELKPKILESMRSKLATDRVGSSEDVAETYLGLLKDYNVDGVFVKSDGGAFVM